MPSARALGYTACGLFACLLLAACILFILVPARLESIFVQAETTSLAATGQGLSFTEKKTVSLFPPAVSFTDLRWGDERALFTLTARSGRATVSLWSLLGGSLELGDVYLDGPVLTYRHAPAPAALTMPAGPASEHKGQAESRRQVGPDRASLPISLRLNRLVVMDGAVIADTDDGGKLSISKLNLSARDLAGGKAGNVECDFIASLQSVSGEYREATLALRGGVCLDPSVLAFSRLQATLTPLRGLYPNNLGPVSLELDGSVHGETGRFQLARCVLALAQAQGTFRGTGRIVPEPVFEGDLRLEASHAQPIAHPLLANLPDIILKGRVTLNSRSLQMPSFELTMGSSAARGNLFYCPESMLLRARVHCGTVDMNRLLLELPPAEQAFLGRGRTGLAKKEESRANSGELQLDLLFNADSLVYKAAVLRTVSFGVSGTMHHLSFSPVRAMIGESGRVDAVAMVNWAERSWNCLGTINNAPLSSVQKFLGGGLALSGTLDAQWMLSSHGAEHAQDLTALNGDGILNVHDLGCGQLSRAIAQEPRLFGLGLPDNMGRAFVPFRVSEGRCAWSMDLVGKKVSGLGQGSLDLLHGTVDGGVELLVRERKVGVQIQGTLREPVLNVREQHVLPESSEQKF